LKALSPWNEYGAVVFNSVGNPFGSSASGLLNTRQFWKIPYSDRLGTKGVLSFELSSNYYNGVLYRKANAIYTDVIEDINGKVAVLMTARADGIDEQSMRFKNAQLVSGDSGVFSEQFQQGWASFDKDLDQWEQNCAAVYSEVSQHYGNCWHYNLGSDADASGGNYLDNDWGPHVHKAVLNRLGLATDGSDYSKVRRISRFVR
jgi:hypothetical protein